jgi:hypothetical protein
MTPEQVLEWQKKNRQKVVDIRFMDFPGVWQHFTVPIKELDESSFEDGFGFDGSSIRGWQPINASDMLVVPDATTAKIDPFFSRTDPGPHRQHRRPGHPGTLHPRPPPHRPEGGKLPQKHRHRRHRLHRAGSGILSSSTMSSV